MTRRSEAIRRNYEGDNATIVDILDYLVELDGRMEAEVECLRAELADASEELMRHQVGESYDVGHEHGSAVAAKFMRERDEARAALAALVEAMDDLVRRGYWFSVAGRDAIDAARRATT